MLTVGEMLKKERIQKNISLAQVEKEIRVREKFLSAVERNDWKPFSSKVYIAGIIQSYAQFLGLDEVKLLAFFRRDYDADEDVRFKKKVKNEYLTPQTKRLAFVLLGLLISFFIAYFAYQLKLYLTPPSLSFIQPTKTEFNQEERIVVRGKTEREASVSIFGTRVYQDEEGIFEYTLPLKEGKNEIIVEVVGANGKRATFRKTFTKF